MLRQSDSATLTQCYAHATPRHTERSHVKSSEPCRCRLSPRRPLLTFGQKLQESAALRSSPLTAPRRTAAAYRQNRYSEQCTQIGAILHSRNSEIGDRQSRRVSDTEFSSAAQHSTVQYSTLQFSAARLFTLSSTPLHSAPLTIDIDMFIDRSRYRRPPRRASSDCSALLRS